ncbi:MAG: hypothetical protein OEY39_04690 [Candidatus Bathyarchaeota archaeon]|nr:hypothetical protein [Candidatus Bathyarchaeota archaeon]MDH5623745.1 hypothetical protein [Candidatus Bathyarchaeota archaeon]MDH5636069.1 hypothetical protein [Candidatus Bathyarchaeota archaeon]MDH5702573.1 hypothetical protein [Candidatus Bathyarchaeota archaeon]
MAFLRSLKKGQESFAKALLRLFSVFLIFGGPTYLLYILDKLEVPRLLVLLVGLAAFAAGIILFMYSSKEEGKVKASS